LRYLAPAEDLLRQLVAFLGEFLEHGRRCRPRAGLGLLAARQPHLTEQDIAKLLGAARIEILARDRADLGLEARGLLRELAREAGESTRSDRDAAPLHASQHRQEGALERLVDTPDTLGGKPQFEHLPQPQRDVGVLGGTFGGLVDADAIEAEPAFAGSGDVVVADGAVFEPALRQPGPLGR